MMVNIVILGSIAVFFCYGIYTSCRSFIGHNPSAPGWWRRIKVWWPAFVKRYIVDDNPYDHEGHSAAREANNPCHPELVREVTMRYRYCKKCAESDGEGKPGGSCCMQCLDNGVDE